MSETKYIKLDEEDFRCLVRGGVLSVGNDLKIVLQDIGFDEMNKALSSAMSGFDIYQGHTKND